MTVAELNTLHTNFEVERTQLVTVFAMSGKHQQLPGFLLTKNRSTFFFTVEGRLYHCPHHLFFIYYCKKV